MYHLTIGKDVYVSAYHVDYWNRLGWKDKFSDAAYSKGQVRYCRCNRGQKRQWFDMLREISFCKNDYRPMEFNDIIQGICKLGEHFDRLEKGQASNFGSLSEEVTLFGFFSNRIYEDLKAFFGLKRLINRE